MRELVLLAESLSHDHVLEQFMPCAAYFKEVVITFKEIMEASVQTDECTLKSLGVLVVKSGVLKHAVRKLEVAMKKDN